MTTNPKVGPDGHTPIGNRATVKGVTYVMTAKGWRRVRKQH